MIENKLIKFSVFVAAVFFTGCINIKAQPNDFNSVVNSLKRDTFYIDAPKTHKGNIGPEFLTARRIENLYDLETIDHGYDSVSIRIWLSYSRYSSGLISIINNGGKWQATTTVYSSKKTNIQDTSFFYEKSSEKKHAPGDNWDTFIAKLVSLGLLTLPSDDSIPSYDQQTGESKRVLVEISTKYFYRIYSYAEPNRHAAYINEAAQLEKILDYLQSQLQFQMNEKI